MAPRKGFGSPHDEATFYLWCWSSYTNQILHCEGGTAPSSQLVYCPCLLLWSWAIYETTASVLDSSSGSVISSETMTKHVSKARAIAKHNRGPSWLNRIRNRSRGFVKDLRVNLNKSLRCWRIYQSVIVMTINVRFIDEIYHCYQKWSVNSREACSKIACVVFRATAIEALITATYGNKITLPESKISLMGLFIRLLESVLVRQHPISRNQRCSALKCNNDRTHFWP